MNLLRSRKSSLILCILVIITIFLSSCTDEKIEKGKKYDDNVVYAYNLNGVAKYMYDEDYKITEAVTLDSITLSEYIFDVDNYTCKYHYDENGILDKLIYFGKEFVIESADNGLVTAVCNSGSSPVEAKLSYSDNGILLNEEYYEKDILVLKNTYDNKGKPKRSEYTGMGVLDYAYEEGTTYITVIPDDKALSQTDISIILDDNGYPKYMMKTADGTIIGTTWAHSDDGLCIDTLIESKSAEYAYIEEYEIYYNENNKVSIIDFYIPNSNQEPILSTRTEYFYSDNIATSFAETKYNDDQTVNERVIYNSVSPDKKDITTEFYKDGNIRKIENSKTEYKNGYVVSQSICEYKPDMTFIGKQTYGFEYNAYGYVSLRTIKNYNDKEMLENVINEEYTYDSANTVTKLLYTVYDSDNNILEKELNEFEYNDNSSIKTKRIQLMSSTDEIISTTVIDYTYDENGEATTVTSTYDAEGNLIDKK